jgi:hypothetical protein
MEADAVVRTYNHSPVPATTSVIGLALRPYDGKLNNAGERIELSMPGGFVLPVGLQLLYIT